MQKKYAKDDPSDFGKALTTSDKADEKRYKKYPVKLGGSGSWGSSGTPDKAKWYSDGVISTDGWVDKKGHYLLGAHRRRVGAGYGRRRAAVAKSRPDSANLAKIENGHPALQEAFGDPADSDERKMKNEGKTSPILKAAGVGNAALTTPKETVAEEKAAALKAEGQVEANPATMTEAEKKTLEATKAGTTAVMDTTGHFTKPVDDRIVGTKTADELDPGLPSWKCIEDQGKKKLLFTESGCAKMDGKFAGVQQTGGNKGYGECTTTHDNLALCDGTAEP